MRELLDLANNPLFVRYIRGRLRRQPMITGIVVTAFLSLCIVALGMYNADHGENLHELAIASQLFFWLQGLILVVLGGSQVAAAIAQMKESGIIDFHRITPVPARVQTLGIMIGAPIRELILYGITLPFALFVALTGSFGLTNFVKLLLVQLGGALMYYSLAMIAGFSGGKARGASGRFVILLAGINIAAVQLHAVLNINGPALVTVAPVYMEVLADIDEREEARRQALFGAPPRPPQGPGRPQAAPPPPQAAPLRLRDERPDATFFAAKIPLVLQSLSFQACVLIFLFIAASRRIHSARMPLYPKPTALLFLSLLAFLTLGSLWRMTTVTLTIFLGYFLTIISIVLINTVTPPLGEVVKGIQRAHKLSRSIVPVWSDLSSNKVIVAALAGVVAATMFFGLAAAPQPPAVFVQNFEPIPCVLVAALAVASYGFASQYLALAFGKRAKGYFILFLFFTWMAPIIIALLLFLAELKEGFYLLAMSPLAGIAAVGFNNAALNSTTRMIAGIAPVTICALCFFALLLSEEARLRRKVDGEHEIKPAKKKRREHESYDDE